MSTEATPAPAPAPSDTPAPVTATPAPAADPAAAPAADPDASLNLFDEPAPAADPAAPDPAAPTDGSAFDLTPYTEAIQPVDLGNMPDGSPIPWDADAVTAVIAVFAKHKVPPEAAKAAVDAYAAHAKAQYSLQFAQQQQAEADLNKAMVTACREKFGPELTKYVKHAAVGGRDIFGEEVWGRLSKINAFSNDPEIINALAARGRAITNDSLPDSGKTTTTDDRPLAKRLYSDPK
jgi:hypothetical protein